MLVQQYRPVDSPCAGITVQRLRIPEQHAWGRKAKIDLSQVTAHLHTGDELLRRSFHPAGSEYLPLQVKSGQSLPEWLKSQSPGNALPMMAQNGLHTNFVRGNGFIIVDHRLICKPPGTVPLDGDQHLPLDGRYTVLWLAPGPAHVRWLELRRGILINGSDCKLAISGPRIVHQGRNTYWQIPVRLPAYGQTLGNEINFLADDETGRSSWTAFGVNSTGRLLAVSVFAGTPQRIRGANGQIIFQPARGEGLTLRELAELMIQLGASDAILAGGSGDTQQMIQAQRTWCARPRIQSGRVQVNSSLRGLGVILAIYGGLTQTDLTGGV